MGLLSNSQKTQIRSVIKQVTDTFMVTPIMYHIAGESIDRFNEDRSDQTFYSIEIKALVEHGLKENFVMESLQGAKDDHHVKLSINLEDLEALNLITTDYKFISNPTKDYFTLKGQLYKVLDVYYDGPLDEKDVLVIIEAEKKSDTVISVNTITTGNQILIDEIVSSSIGGRLVELESKLNSLDIDSLGYVLFNSNSITSENPLTVEANTRTVIPLAADSVVLNSENPPTNYQNWIQNNLFYPDSADDVYIMRLDLDIAPNVVGQEVLLSLDISGDQGVIWKDKISTDEIITSTSINKKSTTRPTFLVFSKDTFKANGGEFSVQIENGGIITKVGVLIYKTNAKSN